MPMTTGSITIASNGDATGDGAAKAIYDIYVGKLGSTLPAGAAGAQAKRQVADLCETIASMIDYIKGNAVITATISTADSGLQRVSGTPTDAPATNKTINGAIT